ncbi:MAG: TIR domain-containing protein [Nitrosomonas sp.]|nr:MAG: TIR domain-containing protein [Nitrosomonas sp.]
MQTPPKVFISYSHDNNEHKDWVHKLAHQLMDNGIETTLDQWDLALGSNLPKFMEKGLTTNDRVLVICTDNYINKANDGIGGVGYEKTILTAELIQDQDSKKFIPIVRNVKSTSKTPTCLTGRLYIDFSDEDTFDNSLKQLLHEIYDVPFKPKPALGKSPFVKEDTRPVLNEDSTVFFSDRFSSAFPGVRGVEWFKNSKAAVDRLGLLLKDPLVFEDQTPIWWWRSGELYIKSFRKVSDSKVIMDYHELDIEEVAAVNKGSYYQCFVYVKVAPSEPSGLYNYSFIKDSVDNRGYAHEEFAIFNDKFITRNDYDDNATIINDLPVNLDGKAEIRIRYLTPYNFIIAPHKSPINNPDFDLERELILNEMLQGKCDIDKFVNAFMKLPKNSTY